MAGALDGKVAWVTGAGSGIGESAALKLAGAGAAVILTGRRAAPLEDVAARIRAQGGSAEVRPADLMVAAEVRAVGEAIAAAGGRLDILVNNAGLNIQARDWTTLQPEGAAEVIGGNLLSAFHCVTVALPFMRARRDGLLIHTASFAGRFVSPLSGPAYTAAKHGVVAMSHSLNMEECVNGIRSTVICPGEVATPILDRRPKPVTAEERARMVQPEDCGDLILYVACLPPRVVLNEVLISPTWNRSYVAQLRNRP
ncbi:SDR family NAD(P)-dependent oxidoreductase [Roseomonas sp. NAR14]|uniref:SDR family NAD(P)-dependent oxidoreductase n=1 Tax=Roseomonas acroporae TaxID=2937791 RepID=A0A9X1Y3K3_9PROT|nr:SDR family NAD(P)-dependent oxidoreductase [Roseomonas acroporae]MCK8782793.1 SDR family NAD(P)-dependent oxidoreductase [Roseomonas acroporae]